MDQNKYIVIAVTFIVGVVLGYLGGLSQGRKSAVSLPSDASAQKKLERIAKIFPVVEDLYSLSGRVRETRGDILVLEGVVSPNPLEDIPAEREVIVTDKTSIARFEPKDQLAFQKELIEYQEKVRRAPSQSPPPAPIAFVEKKLRLSDIKPGEQVNVEAQKNIKFETKFEALRINILVLPPLPVTTP